MEQTFGSVRHFARKVIKRDLETGLLPGHQEGDKLSLVNTLQNPHIVQIVTSFTYRDEFSIVFRRATTNLAKALRQPKYLLSQIVPPLQSCPIWPQMLGLAKALADFSSGGWDRPARPSQSGELIDQNEHTRANPNRSIGIHFDLKPSNILVNRPSRNPPSFHFVVADFGLARIKDLTRGSEGTRSRGGDDAYAPPESAMQDRRYDIWSLGCIFLEILTFLVLGHKGVGDLDKARSAPSMGPARQTPCFWEPVSGGHPVSEEQVSGPSAKLKEGVKKFLDRLHQRACESGDYGPKEQRLITNTITMIKKMLRIEANTRPTAQEVVWWLKQIGRGYKLRTEETDSLDLYETPTTANQESHIERDLPTTNPQVEGGPWWEPVLPAEEDVQLAEERDGETEIEPRSLRTLRRLLIRSNEDPSGDDSNAVLQVFENHDWGTLRFVVTSLNMTGQAPLEQTCLRQHVNLMPQYAFRKNHNTQRSDAGIRLVWKENLRAPIMKYDLSGELNVLRKVQDALLGQQIYHTIEVQDVKLVQPKALLRNALSRKNSREDESEGKEGPFTVQLWREKRPQTPNEARKKPRACRIVMYLSAKVYVIPFHLYFRLPPRDEILEPSLTVLRSSTVQNKKQTFDMTVLQASEPPHILPTFPLDGTQLEDLLTKQPSTFKTVEITFRAHADLYLFWNDYRVLKEDWLEEAGVKPPKNVSSTVPASTLELD